MAENGWNMPGKYITRPCRGCTTTSIDTVHPKGLCEACVTTIDAEWRRADERYKELAGVVKRAVFEYKKLLSETEFPAAMRELEKLVNQEAK